MQFDNLSLMRNKNPIIINKIPLLQPTLGELEAIGYEKYETYLFCLTTTSKSMADVLWVERKIFYEDITDEWDFFIQRAIVDFKQILVTTDGNNAIESMAISDIYRDSLNFFLKLNGEYIIADKTINNIKQTFLYYVEEKVENENDNILFYLKTDNMKFTNSSYKLLTEYLMKINWRSEAYTFLKGHNKKTKKMILENDYKTRISKKTKAKITLSSIVSSLLTKGHSYEKIWDYPIYLIYELYYRCIKLDEWNINTQLYCGGNLDTTKHPMKWDEINWSNVIDKNL